jgi:hypothetical protein
MTTTEPRLRGRALVASAVECSYPPNVTRTVRAPLSGGMPARQPVERAEISSDRGELLATGESLRCDENYAGGVRGG